VIQAKTCPQCGRLYEKPHNYSPKQWRQRIFCSQLCWGASIRIPPADRLMALTHPEPNTGCWLYAGAENGRGYGLIGIDGRQVKAHRFSWEHHHGPIPAGMHVLHKCDVRLCVNPDHLFLGTNYDNVQDKIAKGRAGTIRGSKCGQSVLTEELVLIIRADARSAPQLAAVLGVSPSAIRACRNGQNWRHV